MHQCSQTPKNFPIENLFSRAAQPGRFTMKTWFFNLNLIVKIGILSGFLMLFMFSLAGIAIYLTQQIGIEIEEIAEGDLPMISILTEVEVTQLEQAIIFERAIRQGEKAYLNTQNAEPNEHVKEFEHLSAQFIHLGNEIVTEYHEAEKIITSAISHAASDHTVATFKQFEAKLKEYETLHDQYETQVESVLEMISQLVVNPSSVAMVRVTIIATIIDFSCSSAAWADA